MGPVFKGCSSAATMPSRPVARTRTREEVGYGNCMFDVPRVECQGELPEGPRDPVPLLGARRPARCRNSTITRAHGPSY